MVRTDVLGPLHDHPVHPKAALRLVEIHVLCADAQDHALLLPPLRTELVCLGLVPAVGY